MLGVTAGAASWSGHISIAVRNDPRYRANTGIDASWVLNLADRRMRKTETTRCARAAAVQRFSRPDTAFCSIA